MEIPTSLIAQNVRDFLMTVDDLTNMKFKDVRRAVEKRLGLAKHSLDDKKDDIKDIIRNETLKLHQERTQNEQPQMITMMPIPMQAETVDKPPRKPLSAYMFFCQDKRNELKVQKPTLTNQELVKEMGTMWQALEEKDKSTYDIMANNDKTRYESEVEAWKQRNPSALLTKPRNRKVHMLPDEEGEDYPRVQGPKKPRSAYIYYCQEHRDRVRGEHPGMAPTDISKVLGNEWNALGIDDKQKYRVLEIEDRERYKMEMDDMGLHNNANTIPGDDARKTAPRQSSISSVCRAKSAYIFFCNEKRDDMKQLHPEWTMIEITKELASIWKNMNEDMKKPYSMYAYEDKERVRKEVEKIKATVKSAPYHSNKKERGGKRARTPYTLFYKEQMKLMRDKNKDIGFGEVSKILSEMWKNLTEEQKNPYVEQSKVEHNLLLVTDPQNIKSRKRHLDEPRRPCNSYALFCKSKRGDVKKMHPDISSGDILKELGKIWRETSQEEKDMFEKMAQVEREKYELEKEKYASNDSKPRRVKKHEEPLENMTTPPLYLHTNIPALQLNPGIPMPAIQMSIPNEDKNQMQYSVST
ncbi:hypothetical protein WA158_002043 [Blastocystis sp. Blastoise]